MAAVFQDITLEWKGVEYVIKPNMKLMHRIEQEFSLSRVAHRITQGDTPLSHMATMVGIMLRSAGASVKDEEVFEELLTGEAQAVQDMAVALITAAFPVSQGNVKAPKSKSKGGNTKK